ncbi:unnamed protein product [Absidia cylindrospora]
MSRPTPFVSNVEGEASSHTPPALADLTDEDSSAHSKHAAKPSLEEKLAELRKEANELSMSVIYMDFNDPLYEETKRRLELYSEKINTLEKYSGTKAQVAVNPHILSSIPIFQLTNRTMVNPNVFTFDSLASFIRRFEKVMDVYDVDLDSQWKPYLSYAMDGEDVDIWFSRQLKPFDGTWSQAKKILEDEFSTKEPIITNTQDRPIARMLDLFSIKMTPNESVADFGLRFKNIAHKAQLPDDKPSAMLCLCALPQDLQGKVLDSFLGESSPGDLPYSASQVLEIASKVSQ